MVTILFNAREIFYVRNGGRRSINHRDGLISLSDSHERSPSSAWMSRAKDNHVYGVNV